MTASGVGVTASGVGVTASGVGVTASGVGIEGITTAPATAAAGAGAGGVEASEVEVEVERSPLCDLASHRPLLESVLYCARLLEALEVPVYDPAKKFFIAMSVYEGNTVSSMFKFWEPAKERSLDVADLISLLAPAARLFKSVRNSQYSNKESLPVRVRQYLEVLVNHQPQIKIKKVKKIN